MPSLKALSAIYLLHVMTHGSARRPLHRPNKYMFFTQWKLRARVEIRKASLSNPLSHLVIHYWPVKGGTFIVVFVINFYAVFHILMFFFETLCRFKICMLKVRKDCLWKQITHKITKIGDSV